MKHNCPKLGIDWYSSIGYGYTSCEHPIFSTPLKTLIKHSVDIRVSNEEKVILAAGLVNYLPVNWHTGIDLPKAAKYLLAEFSALAVLASKLDIVDRIQVPQLVISSTSNDLSNLHNWIEIINDAITDEATKQSRYRLEAKLARKEAVIARLLNSQLKSNRNKLAGFIADWASEVAEFPTSFTYTAIGTPVRLADYWKQIITASFKDEHLEILSAGIDYDDLCDLVEWLEYNIPHGSSHAAVLMKEIRKTKGILEEFTARKVRMVETKLPEPKRTQFSSTADFLRAKLAYINSKTEIEPISSIDTRTDTYLDL